MTLISEVVFIFKMCGRKKLDALCVILHYLIWLLAPYPAFLLELSVSPSVSSIPSLKQVSEEDKCLYYFSHRIF